MNNKSKSNLIYLAMGDVVRKDIAPCIRMAAFKQSFRQLLFDKCYCITGKPSQRSRNIKKLIFSGKWKIYDAMYIESSNRGLVFWDGVLIILLRLRQKPVSIFIRDVYPLFLSGWKDTTFKGKMANLLWLISIPFYQLTVTRIYFPAESMYKFIRFKYKDIMPPAINNDLDDKELIEGTIFYAGGLRAPYDLSPVLQAIDRLNRDFHLMFLIYCRKEDVHKLEKWKNKSWLTIEHKTLTDLDFKPQIGIISSDEEYQSIGRSVKLMNYIRLGIPAIISDATENSRFLKKHNIGLIAKPKDSDSFYLALKKLLTDKKLYNLLKENVMQLRNSPEITWTARARKILKDMDFNL